MEKDDDKLGHLLYGDSTMDRVRERLDDLKTLTEIIHDGRVRRLRSSEIAEDIVKFLKEE